MTIRFRRWHQDRPRCFDLWRHWSVAAPGRYWSFVVRFPFRFYLLVSNDPVYRPNDQDERSGL